MNPLRSISARFIAGAVGAGVITFLCLIGLVAFQLEHSIQRQERKLEDLSDARLAELLDADIKLVATRIRLLLDDTERRIKAIANRSDTMEAVATRNVVAMSEMLRPAADNADVDSIVVLNSRGNVIGASSGHADLIALDQKVETFPFAGTVRALLNANHPDSPQSLSVLVAREQSDVLIPGRHDNAVSQIVLVPLFDEFGEVSGGLLAQRWLRAREPLLLELAEINSVGLVVLHGGKPISRAAYAGSVGASTNRADRTNLTYDGTHVVRCGTPIAPLEICALKPVEELYATQAELTKIGKKEQAWLLQVLTVFGMVATTLFIIVSVAISRQITQPLTRITRVVSSIAAGDYEDDVEGTARNDEVGDIARAVVLLQASARERDALRSKVQFTNKALKQQKAKLRDQNTLFDAALNNMSHGLCMFDPDKKLIVSNQRYLELFKLTEEHVHPGMSVAELTELQNVAAKAENGDSNPSNDWPAHRRSTIIQELDDGRIILMTRQPLRDGGWVCIFEDVTERQRARDRLAYLAKHDVLTGLPNRARFMEHLEHMVQRCNSEGGAFGLLCLDLDEFKTVNDSLGHPVGDELLCQVAGRLCELAGGRQLVVRLGGDEFAIVTDIPTVGRELAGFAEQIIAEISRPYEVDRREIAIGVSIGISIAQNPALDGDELFKQADLAMYEAKKAGRNTFRFFEEEMGTTVNVRRELISDLRSAIENGGLHLNFQPQLRLDDETIIGFEALVRWKHPTRGMISPGEFIPIAEETGLIIPLGEWVLREACRTARQWPLPVRIAVNLSARQLKSPGFGAVLVNTLARTGLEPERLELEVTESVLLGDDPETLAILHQAKALGVKVSMDDFGTGYSSLSCLRSFPFDKIKIDQSFVRTMMESEDSQSIVRAIVELAQSLKMTTTAEGVETQELVEVLRACGCAEAQGYFFGRPAPADDAMSLLLQQLGEMRAVANG